MSDEEKKKRASLLNKVQDLADDCKSTFLSRDEVHGSTVLDIPQDTLLHIIFYKAYRVKNGINLEKMMDDIRDMVNFSSIAYSRLKQQKEEGR